MALWTLVLVAAALGVAAAAAKAASFLLGCWSAHRQFLASPIPGPPTSNLFGEEAVLFLYQPGRSKAHTMQVCHPHVHTPRSQRAGHVSHIMGPKGPFTFGAWHAAHGPLYKLQLLDSFVVVLSDPDTIARVTRRTGTLQPAPALL